MIEFKISSTVTPEQLLLAAQSLTAMAHGLGGTVEAPKQVEDAPVDVRDLTDTTPLTTTTTVPKETTASGADGLDLTNLDADGAPWDKSIHASTKTKTAKNVWKKIRGLDATVYAEKTAANIELVKGGQVFDKWVEDKVEDLVADEPYEVVINHPSNTQTPEEVFGAAESPEEVFGANERPDFMGDAPEEVNTPIAETTTAVAALPSTPKELMDRSIAHLGKGDLSLDEVSVVLQQNPNAAGEIAPHLGALAAGDKFTAQVPAIALGISNMLAMKGLVL